MAVLSNLWCAAARALILSDIVAVSRPEKTVVSLVFDGRPEYDYFTLKDPDRLVIDLERSSCRILLPLKGDQGMGLVSLIRASKAKSLEGTRLVFELRQPVVLKGKLSGHGRRQQLILSLKAFDKKDSGELPVIRQDGAKKGPITDNSSKAIEKKSNNLLPIARQATKSGSKTDKSIVKMEEPKVIVAIDAGHGGRDPGAVGPRGLQEKQVTLAISRILAELLKRDGRFKPVMVRNSDTFLAIDQRAEIARKENAQLLVSIHADGAPSSKVRGASAWVLSDQRTDSEMGRWLEDDEKRTAMLALVGDRFIQRGDRYLHHAVLDLQFGHSRRVSHEVANRILKEMGRVSVLHKSSPQHASLGVLQSPNVPSLLVETGFITHGAEERLLGDSNYQRRLAKAIYLGVKGHFSSSGLPGMVAVEGQSLPSAKKLKPALVPQPKLAATHMVRRGESLFRIALLYQTTWQQLQQLNNLKTTEIRSGQKLLVPSTAISSACDAQRLTAPLRG